jgi:hypothetical protein
VLVLLLLLPSPVCVPPSRSVDAGRPVPPASAPFHFSNKGSVCVSSCWVQVRVAPWPVSPSVPEAATAACLLVTTESGSEAPVGWFALSEVVRGPPVNGCMGRHPWQHGGIWCGAWCMPLLHKGEVCTSLRIVLGYTQSSGSSSCCCLVMHNPRSAAVAGSHKQIRLQPLQQGKEVLRPTNKCVVWQPTVAAMQHASPPSIPWQPRPAFTRPFPSRCVLDTTSKAAQ